MNAPQREQESGNSMPTADGGQWLALVLSWIVVGVPTVWGVTQTIVKALALFR